MTKNLLPRMNKKLTPLKVKKNNPHAFQLKFHERMNTPGCDVMCLESVPHIASKITSAELIVRINSSDENKISFSKDNSFVKIFNGSQSENSILLFAQVETILRLNNPLRDILGFTLRSTFWYIISQVFPSSCYREPFEQIRYQIQLINV